MIIVKQPQFTWTHLRHSSKHELLDIQQEYNFHELIWEDLIELSGENKVEYYEDDGVITILINFPKYNTKTEKYLHNPFVIVVSGSYILSVSKYHSNHIDVLANKAQSKQYLADDDTTPTFDLVYDIIDTMYDKSVKWLTKASQDILKLQDQIEAKSMVSRDLLQELLSKKINMSTLQHIFRAQRQTLQEFKSILKKVLHTDQDDVEDAKLYIEDLDAKLDKILDTISLNYNSLQSLGDTYASLIDLQTNKTISYLTVVTVGFGFITLLAGLYGMNVALPGEWFPYMFWVIISISIVAMISGYYFLRWRKLL